MTSNEHTSGFKFITTNGIETGEAMEIIHRDITINSKKQNVFHHWIYVISWNFSVVWRFKATLHRTREKKKKKFYQFIKIVKRSRPSAPSNISLLCNPKKEKETWQRKEITLQLFRRHTCSKEQDSKLKFYCCHFNDYNIDLC